MNDLVEQKSWFKLNWKWFVALFTSLIILFGLLFSTQLGGKIAGMAKIHSESSVYENALEIAKKDKRVIELLGELQPLGNLAIIEGSHIYSNGYNSLEISVNLVGTKTENKIRSKMDILAERNKDEWIYKVIKIRIKKPNHLKQTIEIIKLEE